MQRTIISVGVIIFCIHEGKDLIRNSFLSNSTLYYYSEDKFGYFQKKFENHLFLN